MFTSQQRSPGHVRSSIRQKLLPPLLVALFIVVIIVAQYYFVDQLKAYALGEATVYAKGYSENRFRSIWVGMPMADVFSVMGPPLKWAPWGDYPRVWFYSDQETITDNFWRKWIVVDPKNDRVDVIVDDFWVD
jgi:hypothetical protein